MKLTTRHCPSFWLAFGAFLILMLTCVPRAVADGTDRPRLELKDVFELEFASDPQVSPDGTSIVYVRNSFDIMTDRQRSQLWQVGAASHLPLTSGESDSSSPRLSPDGSRLAYFSTLKADGKNTSTELFCRWLNHGVASKLTQLPRRPEDLKWSPDGRWLAFSMRVPVVRGSLIDVPTKPKGATWAEPPEYIDRISYRYDGKGYLEDGYHHIFVLPVEGGTPRQITSGDFDHKGPFAWTDDGQLIVSTNRSRDWELDPRESDLYSISVETGKLKRLTDRRGPDESPVISPDGSKIAWLGFDDRKIGSQLNRLYVMNRDGSDRREISTKFDRSLQSPVWMQNNSGLFVQFDDEGHSKLAGIRLDGQVTQLASDVGGTTIGRPYQSGSFSVSTGKPQVIAFTETDPHRPADVAVLSLDGSGDEPKRVTSLNADLFRQRGLAEVEEFWFESAHDGLKIQAWLVKPQWFDPKLKPKYPLILEIHGGPFASYGWRFSMEMQLYAAAGYAVLYVNPRGSTGYGQKFVEQIHHAYPGHDYDDLMTAVDVVLKRGFIDEDQLYVTGGSGGGILTAWIVGKTERFRAAVSAKPVINWHSFALTTDVYPYFWQYWFSDYPWRKPEEYLKRSPLSLVDNVVTPTMLLTGENDHRTPISESEQFYQALKLRGIDAALVRVPDASHGIVKRPSNLMNKVAYILSWFKMHAPENVDP
jgi:acylaminoacyl-peptidase